MGRLLMVHLVQSTAFAAGAGVLTLAFRRNRAEIRYWLWLSASIKLLVPFALLMSLGSALESWFPATRGVAEQISRPAVAWTAEQFAEPIDHRSRALRILADQGVDGVQRVEQEVWMQLPLQRLELGLGDLGFQMRRA